MVQLRAARSARPPAAAPRVRPEAGEDIQDVLGSITDRDDLEKLYERQVGLPSILKIMGRQISREEIHQLLLSPHPEKDVRKLLD
jgi:hypothetical protein